MGATRHIKSAGLVAAFAAAVGLLYFYPVVLLLASIWLTPAKPHDPDPFASFGLDPAHSRSEDLEAAIETATGGRSLDEKIGRLRRAGFSCELSQSPPVCSVKDRLAGGMERFIRATWDARDPSPRIAISFILTWF